MDGTARGHDRDHALGIACGAGAGALWGLVFLAPALAHDATPLQLAVGRYLAFGLLSVALLGRRGRALAASLHRRDLWWLAALALSGNTLYYVLLSTAVQQGGIAMTALVIGFLPVTVTIIGSREAGAVPLARLAPALLLCAAGALCIGWPALATAGGAARAPGGAGALAGLVCAVGALVAWTLYAVGNSRCLARLTRVSVHEWNLLVGVATGVQALALLPFALVPGAGPREPAGWLRLGGVSIAVALLASVAGNALWNRMSRLLPLTLAGQMILFETLFALVYAWWWERRLPRPLELLALMLVVAGVLSCLAAHRAPRLLSAAGARE